MRDTSMKYFDMTMTMTMTMTTMEWREADSHLRNSLDSRLWSLSLSLASKNSLQFPAISIIGLLLKNLPGVESEMHEDSMWSLRPVQDIDQQIWRCERDVIFTVLWYKESLKQTMLEQESVFEDQLMV